MGHQRHVQDVGVGKLADRLEAQRGNPAQAGILFEGVDLRCVRVPRSPTKTTRSKRKRVRSWATWFGSVVGSADIPR